MTRPAGSREADTRTVRAAALRTALQVAAVATAVVLAAFALAVLFLVDQSRPTELLERPAPGETRIYVAAGQVLAAVVLLGVSAVLAVGLAAWAISRRAVAPLAAALRIQRAFVADASHELRTPLTVLDARLQVLGRRLTRGEPAGEVLAAARQDTRVMIDLVTDLLLLAEADAEGAGAALEEACDLAPVLRSIADDLELLGEERDVTVRVSVANEARVGMPEGRLRRALVVLVDNAIRHSPASGRVDVTAETHGRRAVIRVRDQGGGIAGVDVDQVFQRFTRGADDGSRRRFGIGLALARDLAVGHGGTVTVESTSSAGTVLRLELPVAG